MLVVATGVWCAALDRSDRSSFAVRERLGMSRVAAFDDDFAVYRYGRDMTRAFEPVR